MKGEDEEEKALYTAFSIIFCLASNLFMGLSFIFMRIAHLKKSKEEAQDENTENGDNEKGCVVCHPFWLGGLFCGGLGIILQLLSLNFGNQVLLSGLMTLGVLFSYMLSILILKEPCHK